MHGCRLSLVLLAVFYCTAVADGHHCGHWPMPSTSAQFCGHGNGAGHHAPQVRTRGGHTPRVPRVKHVQACQLSNRSLPYESIRANCGFGDCYAHMETDAFRPTTQQHSVATPPSIAPLPKAFAESEPMFAAPVQQPNVTQPRSSTRSPSEDTLAAPVMPDADFQPTTEPRATYEF